MTADGIGVWEEMEYPAWNGRLLHIAELILAGKVGTLLEMNWGMA